MSINTAYFLKPSTELYQSGEEPENETWVLDWADWAGAYKILLRRQEQYRRTIAAAHQSSFWHFELSLPIGFAAPAEAESVEEVGLSGSMDYFGLRTRLG